MSDQKLRETAAVLIFADLTTEEWLRLTDEESENLLNSKMEYLRSLGGSYGS